MGPGTTFHRVLWDDAAARARREDQARAGRRDPARRAVLGQGLLRPLRGARGGRHRRRLPDARRAALSVPGARADARAVALPAGGDRLGQEEPKNMGAWSFIEPNLEWVLERIDGARAPAALRRPRCVGGDGDRALPASTSRSRRRWWQCVGAGETERAERHCRQGRCIERARAWCGDEARTRWRSRSTCRRWANRDRGDRRQVVQDSRATRSRPTSRWSSSRPTR